MHEIAENREAEVPCTWLQIVKMRIADSRRNKAHRDRKEAFITRRSPMYNELTVIRWLESIANFDSKMIV